jgi:predicted Zn-dependent peptidase
VSSKTGSRAYTVSRDQTAVCYAGLSVARTSDWYDALIVLNQILCGGELGSMYALLFQIREQTGLFYAIQGSTVLYSGIFPGIVRIKMLVSPDSVDAVDQEIKKSLRSLDASLSHQIIVQARSSIIAAHMQHILCNEDLAHIFTLLAECGILQTSTLQLSERLARVSVDTVRAAAHQFLNPDSLLRITVGR